MPPYGGKMGPEGARPSRNQTLAATGPKQGLTGPKGQTELAATRPPRGRDQGALLSKA